MVNKKAVAVKSSDEVAWYSYTLPRPVPLDTLLAKARPVFVWGRGVRGGEEAGCGWVAGGWRGGRAHHAPLPTGW